MDASKTAPGKPVPTSRDGQAAAADHGGAEGSKTGGRTVSGHQILFLFRSWFTLLGTDMQLTLLIIF